MTETEVRRRNAVLSAQGWAVFLRQRGAPARAMDGLDAELATLATLVKEGS